MIAGFPERIPSPFQARERYAVIFVDHHHQGRTRDSFPGRRGVVSDVAALSFDVFRREGFAGPRGARHRKPLRTRGRLDVRTNAIPAGSSQNRLIELSLQFCRLPDFLAGKAPVFHLRADLLDDVITSRSPEAGAPITNAIADKRLAASGATQPPSLPPMIPICRGLMWARRHSISNPATASLASFSMPASFVLGIGCPSGWDRVR